MRFAAYARAAVLLLFAAACGTIGEECLQRRDYDCALVEARVALGRNPRCCRCQYIIARSEEALTLPAQDKVLVNQYVQASEHLDGLFQSAVACAPKNKEALRAAISSRERVQQAKTDRDPAIWAAVQELIDADRRIRAALAHRVYYGDQCPHDVESELRNYLGYLERLRSAEIRVRLPLLHDTSIHAEAVALAIAHSFEELQARNDPDAWEASRLEFAGTKYELLLGPEVQRALNAAVDGELDPDRVLGFCRRLEDGADRERCQERFRFTLREQLNTLIAAKDIEPFCSRFDQDDDIQFCLERFRQAALNEARQNPSTNTIALARRACRKASCAREAIEIEVAFVVRRSYDRFDAEKVRPAEVKRSRGAWQDFITSMDAYVRHHLGSRSSLETVAPEIHSRALRRIDAARIESLNATGGVSRDWSVTRREIYTWYLPNMVYRTKWLGSIDSYIGRLITAMQIDQRNNTAKALMNDLIAERRKLDNKTAVQIGVGKVVMDLGVGAAIGGAPAGLRRALTVGYAVVTYLRDN